MTEQSKESQEKSMRLLTALYERIDKFVDDEGSLDNREAFSVLHTLMLNVFCQQFPLEERKEKFMKICEEIIKPGSPLYQQSISDILPK